MSLALHRLGRFIGRHRLAVIGVWVAVLLLIGGVGFGAGAAFEDDNSIPGTESQEGQDVLATRFGSSASGASAQLLFRADDGDITGADDRAVMQARLDEIATVDGVAGGVPPGGQPGPGAHPGGPSALRSHRRGGLGGGPGVPHRRPGG